MRGEHGGNRNPTGRNQHTTEPQGVPDMVKVSNIHVDHMPERPAGTTAQAGLRRLEKAASAGDGNAADLLHRVVNPDDAMTVNGACVAMGWHHRDQLLGRSSTEQLTQPDMSAGAALNALAHAPMPVGMLMEASVNEGVSFVRQAS